MCKRRYIPIAVIVMIFSLLCTKSMNSGALERAENDTNSIMQSYEALDLINEIRAAMGLPFMAMDDALRNMAKSHSRYMNEEKIVSFEELVDNEAYTGAYPLDRGTYFQYDKIYIAEYNQQRMTSYVNCLQWSVGN